MKLVIYSVKYQNPNNLGVRRIFNPVIILNLLPILSSEIFDQDAYLIYIFQN